MDTQYIFTNLKLIPLLSAPYQKTRKQHLFIICFFVEIELIVQIKNSKWAKVTAIFTCVYISLIPPFFHRTCLDLGLKVNNELMFVFHYGQNSI